MKTNKEKQRGETDFYFGEKTVHFYVARRKKRRKEKSEDIILPVIVVVLGGGRRNTRNILTLRVYTTHRLKAIGIRFHRNNVILLPQINRPISIVSFSFSVLK